MVKSQSAAQHPSVPQPSARATDRTPGTVVSSLTGDIPASDTTTQVTGQTCDGWNFTLNAAEKKMFDLHNSTRRAHGLHALMLVSGAYLGGPLALCRHARPVTFTPRQMARR